MYSNQACLLLGNGIYLRGAKLCLLAILSAAGRAFNSAIFGTKHRPRSFKGSDLLSSLFCFFSWGPEGLFFRGAGVSCCPILATLLRRRSFSFRPRAKRRRRVRPRFCFGEKDVVACAQRPQTTWDLGGEKRLGISSDEGKAGCAASRLSAIKDWGRSHALPRAPAGVAKIPGQSTGEKFRLSQSARRSSAPGRAKGNPSGKSDYSHYPQVVRGTCELP